MARSEAPKKCLCGCGSPAVRRGLAAACYAAASRDVARGLVTWEELEKNKLSLPPVPRQQRRRSKIGQKIDALVAKRSAAKGKAK